MDDNIIRAVRVNMPYEKDKSLDLYKLQTHAFEKRVGLAGASESLGYSKNWLGRLRKEGVKRWNALLDEGFTGYEIEVRVPNETGSGATIAKTISIRDYNKLLAYEAIEKKNVKAIVLLVAFSEAGIERVMGDAFAGASLAWFGEKIVHYSQWTYEELEEVLQYNREEVRTLYPWGEKDVNGQLHPLA